MHAPNGGTRAHDGPYQDWRSLMPAAHIAQKRAEADSAFHRSGITVAVYGENAGKERLIPFDIVPRIIPAAEWELLERGRRQRVNALNAFVHAICHGQHIVKTGLIPAEQVFCNAHAPRCRASRCAGALCSRLRYSRIKDISARGLHAVLTDFLDNTADLGSRIAQDFLLPIGRGDPHAAGIRHETLYRHAVPVSYSLPAMRRWPRAAALGTGPAEALDSPVPLQARVDAVFARAAYVQGVSDVCHTASEVLRQGQGVCQDMAHVFLACCRARGSAGAWVGFDVTHQRLAGPELCRLAVGRDLADASPMRGIHVGGGR